MSTYVTSDVHGCRKTFNKLLGEIGFTKEDKLVINGDIIDRGPDSKGLIEDILQLKNQSYNVVFIKGNHEDFMMKAHTNERVFDTWTYPPNGGDKTLANYGWHGHTKTDYGWNVDRRYTHLIPNEHWLFLRNGLITYEQDNFVIVHAGLDFSKENPISQTPEYDKLWNRRFQYDGSKIGDRYLVVGHTPTDRRTIVQDLIQHKNPVIHLDNGCVFKEEMGFGHLCCLKLDTLDLIFVENCDRSK